MTNYDQKLFDCWPLHEFVNGRWVIRGHVGVGNN